MIIVSIVLRKWDIVRMTKKCLYCGKEFEPKHYNQKYCSPECAKEADRTNSRDYFRRKQLQKKIDVCKAKHGDCYDCDMPVGVCRYD